MGGRQDNYVIELLERAFLVQQKRVWSLETLAKLERKQVLGTASEEQRGKMRAFLEGNLRIAKYVIDEIAKELGYTSGMRKILDPTFVLGARGESVSNQVLEKLDRVDSSQREAGTDHYASMMRELLVTHEGFLEDVQSRVHEDVAMQSLLDSM
ncbi:MAG: hypothetical protein ACAI25_08845 [Planctomycetota bacterium]